MGLFNSLSNVFSVKKDMNIEDFMSAAEAEDIDVMHQDADFYVKPISLQTEADVKIVEEELNNKNLVLLNIAPIARNPQKLKSAVEHLRKFARNINGDIARIDEDKVLLTPGKVKIVKKRK